METKGMKLVKFFKNNCDLQYGGGQGVIGITCRKLWEMKDDEFDKLFAQDKEVAQK